MGRSARTYAERALEQGRSYHDQGRVTVLEVHENTVLGVVDGRNPYAVTLDPKFAERGVLEGDCTCPAFEKYGRCKHMWAMLFAFLEETGSPVESLGENPSPQRTETVPWEQRVSLLVHGRGCLERDPWAAMGQASSRLVYVLLLQNSIRSRCLVVEIFRYRRLKDGRWARGRRIKIGSGREERVKDQIHGPIMELIHEAGEQETPSWYGNGYRDRVELRGPYGTTLIPMLCKSGAFRLLEEGETETTIEWDGGDPWSFVLQESQQGNQVVFHGMFVRDDQTVDLQDVRLLLGKGSS